MFREMQAKKVYEQVDNLAKCFSVEGLEVLSSKDAYETYPFLREYFKIKPKEGYFIYVKEQPKTPLSTCIFLKSKGKEQKLYNFLIIEKGIKAKTFGICLAKREAFDTTHNARGFIILKDNAFLEYTHSHNWRENTRIFTDYTFILEKNAKLKYYYKVSPSGNRMRIKTTFILKENASIEIKLAGDIRENAKINIEDVTFLNGKNANALLSLKFIARKNAQVIAKSKIYGNTKSKGHLVCDGLLIEKGKLDFIPEIICKSREAELTHEAAIGKIASEKINYLRARGLTEEEAVKLIIKGFLD